MAAAIPFLIALCACVAVAIFLWAGWVARPLIRVVTFAHDVGVPRTASHGCGRSGLRPASRKVGNSKHWAVITTIFELNPAVTDLLECWKGSSIVVVGDCKTNSTLWRALESPRLVYLSPDDQVHLPYKIVKHIPWNHFGRKSIGFMFAIHHGADLIYDFDDDNSVNCGPDSMFHKVIDDSQDLTVDIVRTGHYVHNPYPWFNPKCGLSQSNRTSCFVWPRGFPLAWITDATTFTDNTSMASLQIHRSRVAVYQSLADHDPDVDAIYRMNRKLPVYFEKQTSVVRAMPAGTFSPWNAQAVLFRSPAFWGMMLPITVSPRVSDIWRSYITMCLMWKIGYYVAFTAPMVTQHRNPHLYMKDYDDEHDLYDKADLLLSRLAAWLEKWRFGSLDEAFIDLIRDLTVGPTRFLEPEDLALAEAWAADLRAAGYQWPPIAKGDVKVALRAPQVVDGRHDGEQEGEGGVKVGLAAFEPASEVVDGRHDGGTRQVAVCLHGLPSRVNGSGAAFKEAVVDFFQPDVFIVSPHLDDSTKQEFQPLGVDADDVTPEVYLARLAAGETDKNAWRSLLKIKGNWIGPLNHDTKAKGSGAYQVTALRRCHDLVLKAERTRGQNYSSILVSRLDLMWLLPHPRLDLSKQPGCHIPCQGNDFYGFCDHLAYCGRESARVYMVDRTAPFADAEYRRGFINDFPKYGKRLNNVEQHVRYVLERKHVHTYRYKEAAFRACATPKSLGSGHGCVHIPELGMWGKPSGPELSDALGLWKRAVLSSAAVRLREP